MEFKRGSILKRKIYGIYYHMGIFCNENQVYHFHKTGKGTSIACTSLVDFGNGRKVSVHLEPEDEKHAGEIIDRAEGAFRNKRWSDNYSLLFLNCEDFVAYCYGRRYSHMKQTTKTALVLAVVVSAVITVKKKWHISKSS